MSRVLTVGLAAIVVVAIAAPGAQALKTVGSNLQHEPTAAICPIDLGAVTHGCTEAIAGLDEAAQAPAGPVVPSQGVIVKWRIARGGDPFPVTAAFRVIRGTTGVATSAEVTLPVSATRTYEFPTRLPVEAGDLIGVDLTDIPGPAGVTIAHTPASFHDALDEWRDPLANGATAPPSSDNRAGIELMINADLEPDADRDGFGDETQDACPTIPTTQLACHVGAPETTITKAPKKKTTKPKASVAFTSSLPGSNFQCSLDGLAYQACTSPWKVKGLGTGEHFVTIRALVNQIPDPTPARAAFTVKKKKTTRRR